MITVDDLVNIFASEEESAVAENERRLSDHGWYWRSLNSATHRYWLERGKPVGSGTCVLKDGHPPGCTETGDTLRRTFIGDVAQCGCRWYRDSAYGDVLKPCETHKAYNPELPEAERETNRDWILRELDDLVGAIDRVRAEIMREGKGDG